MHFLPPWLAVFLIAEAVVRDRSRNSNSSRRGIEVEVEIEALNIIGNDKDDDDFDIFGYLINYNKIDALKRARSKVITALFFFRTGPC